MQAPGNSREANSSQDAASSEPVPSDNAPDYEVQNEVEYASPQTGGPYVDVYVSTDVDGVEELRAIAQDVAEDYPDAEAVNALFTDDDGIQVGSAQVYADEEAARAFLAGAYDTFAPAIEENDYTIVTAGSGEETVQDNVEDDIDAAVDRELEEVCAESDAEMRSILECP